MLRPRRHLILVTLSVLLVTPACGLRHHTVKTRTGTLMVTPATGKVQMPFALTASGFRPGEAMTFEIDVPGKAPFIGPSHTADPQGTVSTTYVPLTGDPAGVYKILAVGNQGTRAEGSVMVTG